MAPAWEHHRCSGHQQPLHLPRQGQLKGNLPLLTPDPPWIWGGLQGEPGMDEKDRDEALIYILLLLSQCLVEFLCWRSAETSIQWLYVDKFWEAIWIQLEEEVLKIKNGLSFFKFNLIYFAMRTPGESKRIAAWLTWCSSPPDPEEKGGTLNTK